MSDPRREFSIGDRVRVSDRCYNARLHGAVGVVAPKINESVNWSNEQIAWVVFDPWIVSDDGHDIEASEIDFADLDPA
jgi:hypothetical protein